MGVVAWSAGQAQADLALALTASSTRVAAVCDVAIRAATEMVGDCAGLWLLREDGRYATPRLYHPEPGRAELLAKVLAGPGEQAGEGYSARLRTTREPVVLPSLTRQEFEHLAPEQYWSVFERTGVYACLLFPLVVDGEYAGYLALVRTTEGRTYTPSDVELGGEVAAEAALALHAARFVERLLASEQRYRCIVETTLEGVWQLDADGVTTFVNEPMALMVGLPRDQMVGLSMRGFLDNRGQTELPKLLAAAQEGQAGLFETRLVRADGTVRWVQVSVAGEGPGAGGALCMFTDITDKVQERGLKRQLDHLRRLDSLGQLIGGIAHDFNNLLTVVAGSAELLAGEAPPGSSQRALSTQIMDATVKGRTLAHQLLAFGRGGGGGAETILVPDLLNDVQQLLSRTLGEHIRLDVSIDDDVWPLRADRGPLEQVMVNLAANARDAMPSGGVLSIHASNTTIAPGDLAGVRIAGRFVRIAVGDTGAGMDAGTLQRAFEPFFTTKPTAAGLGLATAESIIRTIEGHIALDSRPRMGTTITLYLPAAQVAPEVARAAAPAGTGKRGHILVVEDRPELAQLIRYLLQPAGYTVTVATDPHTALTYVNANLRPDLLVTDVVMPGMTGPELARTLRERRPDLRVLYMSGYTASVLGPEEESAELSGFIQKPFNRDTLLAAVQRIWH
ncbi:MAG TPA: response regulator [Rugosimonospora sp.]|nr:response regulator [Rugosimonospora sp.]